MYSLSPPHAITIIPGPHPPAHLGDQTPELSEIAFAVELASKFYAITKVSLELCYWGSQIVFVLRTTALLAMHVLGDSSGCQTYIKQPRFQKFTPLLYCASKYLKELKSMQHPLRPVYS